MIVRSYVTYGKLHDFLCKFNLIIIQLGTHSREKEVTHAFHRITQT